MKSERMVLYSLLISHLTVTCRHAGEHILDMVKFLLAGNAAL